MKRAAKITTDEKAQTRAWVENWEKIGRMLEAWRRQAVRQADTAAAIEAFALAYKAARLHLPPRKTSGLVEQQRWFRRGRR